MSDSELTENSDVQFYWWHSFLTSPRRRCELANVNGVLQRCAKRPRNVQNAVCGAEMSAPIVIHSTASCYRPEAKLWRLSFCSREGPMLPLHMMHWDVSTHPPSDARHGTYPSYYADICSGGSRISPRRGRQLPGGHQHTNLSNFLKNDMELKEFGPHGGVHPSRPLRSATDLVNITGNLLKLVHLRIYPHPPPERTSSDGHQKT